MHVYANVNVHIHSRAAVSAEVNDIDGRQYMLVTTEDAARVDLFINSKAKAIELANAILAASEKFN